MLWLVLCVVLCDVCVVCSGVCVVCCAPCLAGATDALFCVFYLRPGLMGSANPMGLWRVHARII